MYQLISQLLPPNSDFGTILQFMFSIAFLVYLFYAQRIQTLTMLKQVEGTLTKLMVIKDEGRRIAIKTVKEVGKPKDDPAPYIDRMLEEFILTPVDLDPAGIIWKLEQIMNINEELSEEEVKAIAPEAGPSEAHNLEMLIGAAMTLNTIYKVIRHFYLLGKKTMNIYIILQVQMILPQIIQEVETYASALQAFTEGTPVGDGAGAITAAVLMRGHESHLIAKDTVMAEIPFEGRTLLVIKAQGPGGNVGKPGDAVNDIIEEKGGKIVQVIMIDAAGKLEGEEVGSIAEGVGAAIGGIGVDKYKIEEVALKYKIPVYAIAIKVDIKDVLAPVKEPIFDGAVKAADVVKRFVKERTKEGDVVMVVGVGNTVGIAQ